MKQRFTILWIEDKDRVINRNEKELISYFGEKYPEFELNMLRDNSSNNINLHFKENDIDLIVSDNNLTRENEGLEVLEKIRKKKNLTDLLLYSAIDIGKEIINKAAKKGFVEVIVGKAEVTDKVKRLIDKNMGRYEDIVFLRGLVISRIIDLEIDINHFFALYFGIPSEKLDDFHNFILENQYNSMGGKVTTLDCMTKKHKIEKEFNSLLQDIRYLANQRNKLAHCRSSDKDDNVLVFMGANEEYDKKKICSIMRKLNETSDNFQELTKKLRK